MFNQFEEIILNIVRYNPIVRRLFTNSDAVNQQPTFNLQRVGILYIIAAMFQAGWLYVVASNWQVAKQWASLPIFGWACAAIWLAMLWLIIHLPYIGLKMISYSKDSSAVFAQSRDQKRRLGVVITLLMLGIILDFCLFSLLINVEDTSAAVFFSAVMGGRIVQANMEAVFQYYGT